MTSRRRGIDSDTKDWIRNASDELAAKAGYRFDAERAQHAVDWIQETCVLYEGASAGEPLILRDWQAECTRRLFGWVGYSEFWQQEIRRFREASVWVPKKNKKTPTLAAWALYTFAGDGEPGQKCFLCAKDGKQVRENLARHVVEMVDASPTLTEECTINRQTMQVTHLPSKSIILPLSSSNKFNSKSKEGLNGSNFIDETHVVDRPFVNRINRAGISRMEPLHCEVSTAGDNPECYGKERFNLAQAVIDGRQQVDHLFGAIYAVPQDLTEEQFAQEPLKYGRMANPAMGHTVNPEEFLADYNTSKTSIQGMASFLMYRCNKWAFSASPWLKPTDWNACFESYTEDDLAGQVCYGGLDLARVNDFSSFVLLFPRPGGGYRQLAWYWLPEQTARERAHLAPFLEWADRGFIYLTPGKTRGDGVLVDDIIDICKQYRVRAFAYDRMYFSEEIHSRIENEGGTKAYEFAQTVMNYAKPTSAYEKHIIDGTLKNDGNPVLAWQAGHVQVYRDSNGNMKPSREDKDDHRTIDGIQAGVMALAMAMDQEGAKKPCVYETRGVQAF